MRLHLKTCRILLVPAVEFQDSSSGGKEIWIALRIIFLDDPYVSELASHRCHFSLGTVSGHTGILHSIAYNNDSISGLLHDRLGHGKVWFLQADTYTMCSVSNTVNAYPQLDLALALADVRDTVFGLIPLEQRVRLAWWSCEPHMQLHPHPALQVLPQEVRLAHFAAFELDALDDWLSFDEVDVKQMEIGF